jgi:hypothetical protein
MRNFVSVHFPKAGGTSLRNQLQANLGDKLILDYEHDPVAKSEAGDMHPGPLPGIVGVHGHFCPARYQKWEDSYFITFLRDPVENLISIYYFWSLCPTHGNPVHDRFISERPVILDFAKFPKLRYLMSRSYFSDFDMKRFDFIGFIDNREDDMTRLGRLLDIPLSGAIHDNRTTGRQDAEGAKRLASGGCEVL